jgi:indolepyruvate ferredoxin oxidoreductase alpha subunit
MHSSQNEQDSRHYAVAAKIPMLEPSDSQECADYVRLAYELSEKYDTPVFLRLSTRVSHSKASSGSGSAPNIPSGPMSRTWRNIVMSPGNAIRRHPLVEARTETLTGLANSGEINKIIPGDRRIGVIAAGIAYDYAREALGEGASYLKLGLIYPLPPSLSGLRRRGGRAVHNRGAGPIIETHVRAMGIPCRGKALWSLMGEYTAEGIRSKVLGTPARRFTPPATCPPARRCCAPLPPSGTVLCAE